MAKVAAAFVASVGCLVLIGWILDISVLKSVLPNLVTMKPNTALGFVLAGTSLFALAEPQSSKKRWIGQICSFGVVAIALATLSEYLFGWNLGIDELLFVDDTQAVGTLTPGRMSPLAAICFTFVGSALWLSARPSPSSKPTRWVETLAILTSLIALQVIVAYLYQVQPIIAFHPYTQMAVHSAVCFVVLAIGILLANPDQGLMRIIAANSAGGITTRRLLPAAIAIPSILGWLRIATARIGLFESAFGTSILVILDIITFAGLVIWNGQQLHRLDLQKQTAARALSQANQELEARIQERTAELQAANERLNLAIEGAGMATWDMDLQTGKGMWSAQHFNLMGYDLVSSGEATIKMWRNRIYPEDLEQVRQIEERAKRDRQILSFEYRIIDPNNDQLRWLKSIGRFFYNEVGEAVCCRGILFDITDSKVAQEERDRFFVLSLDMMCVAGIDGYFKQVNPAWEKVLGYTQAEILAQPFYSFVHPEDLERTRQEVERYAADNNASAIFENRYRCKDGSYKWLSWKSVAVSENDLIYAVARDVTVPKQAEDELAKQTKLVQRQADLLELTSEAIFVRDERGAITYWNRGAEAKYGWTPPEAMGHITHTFLQTQPPELASNLDRILLEQERWQGELTHTCKHGQQIIVDSRQVLIRDEQGNPCGFLEVNRDITERKQAEADLQKYKDIFQFAQHGLAISRGAVLERVNPAFARIHGYSVEELTGTQILDLFPPEIHTQTMEFIQQLNQVEHLTLESFHIRKDGSVFPVLLDITMVDDEPNLPYRIVNLVDISDRKQAEQEILNLNQELERQLAESQTLLEVIPIGIGIAEDPQCEKIRVNSAFAQMLAISPNANASLSAPEGDRPTNFQIYQNHRQLAPEDLPLQLAAAQGIEVRDFEIDVVWNDGTTLTLLEYAAPLFDERRQTRGSIGVFLDITERKRSEMALQNSLKDLADFKFALDRSSIVAITDTQGTITYVNDKFCELSQYSKEELIGQNHRIINSGYHPKEFFRQLWKTISNGEVWQGEIKNRAKDGTFYWVATTIVPFLDATGKPYQYIAVRSDITNRKTAEAELLQLNTTLEQRVEERTAQLREANKDLEAFSYTVAHDLRAPLRGIQGFAEALVDDYGERLDETAQEYIDYIVQGIERMNELISDLLAYSRLSREQIRLTPVRLTQILTEAQAQLEADIRDSQAEITVATDLPVVLGQRSVLVQMVVNLLSNAMKFVAPGIQPQIKIWFQTHENWVRLWVEDNGIGIQVAHQQQIFGVFERLHGIEAYPGTGIGLAIVRKGAERLGGQAGVESASGQGSRFWIELQGIE
ncbi:MAG: PAS domain S-box protein [Nostoc sp. ChiSLP02]|nr:PAS domain S-box protein [Nostoc sp. DedSLP05]MDZ8103273.1 PAS domain S-box protein [Nostoc sp. DedSLP01]MDZ8187720.1 PAS domain S-box protein [Nostoc sp. ChiSLP02]